MEDSRKGTDGVAKQGIRYILVGGSTALLELVLFQVLFWQTPLEAAGANIIAVSCATLFNFLVNRSFTFKSSSNPLRSIILYSLLFVFNMAFSSSVIQLIVDRGGLSLIAKLFTMACIVLWNFALYRKVIFK